MDHIKDFDLVPVNTTTALLASEWIGEKGPVIGIQKGRRAGAHSFIPSKGGLWVGGSPKQVATALIVLAQAILEHERSQAAATSTPTTAHREEVA